MIIVANRIKEILDSMNKTPYWLAQETRISTNSIYNLINNEVDLDDMRYGTAKIIAQALGVNIEDLRSNEQS